jgi:hypothetical protein
MITLLRPTFLLAALVLLATVYGLGRLHQAQAEEAVRNELIIQNWEDGDRHVASYRKKVAELTDARTVSDRLRGLCSAKRSRGPGSTAPAHAPDTADRRADGEEKAESDPLDQLGEELLIVQDNRHQCEELIELVGKQVYNRKKKGWWEFWK